MERNGLIVPILLCGGTGTRLWPLSRETYPKQFIAINGQKTLLQQTAERLADSALFGRPMVVANNDHRFIVAEQLRAVGIPYATIIVEPVARNTAPAAAAAALHAQERDADALILIMPADHAIDDSEALLAAIDAA